MGSSFRYVQLQADFSWDTEPFTQRQIVEILQELVLFHSDSSPAFSMYIHVHEKLLLNYISALEEAGFKWTIFTWVKGEAVKVKHQSYGRSTELILVCSIGDLPRSYTVNMPATPAARANVAVCNSVPDGAMLTNAQNQVINGAQKPTCIAQMFAHDLTQGGPNSTVLVLGGGSGSEVVGALQNGNSVVVFEKDQVQFRAMQARLEQALGVHTTVLTVIPPDQQPKTLLVEPAEYAWQRPNTTFRQIATRKLRSRIQFGSNSVSGFDEEGSGRSLEAVGGGGSQAGATRACLLGVWGESWVGCSVLL